MALPKLRLTGLAIAAIAMSFIFNGCDCGALPLPSPDGSVSTGGGVGGGGLETGGGTGLGGGAGGGETTGGGTGTGGGTADDGGVDAGTLPDGGCPPVSCAGKCGPIRDFCSGAVIECGGCTNGLVCNLATNVCGAAAVNCGDLGAECGQIRNSCGKRLNCGACADPSKECDRNTNKCIDCSNPNPADLGYQCGSVWLGCGPYSNVTDAGSCAPGSVCNESVHICEPQCSPDVGAIIAATGAQCGLVRDGCGGLIDAGAGCASGLSCGARGVPNRCDPPEFPDECVAANRNCGTYTSACGGPALNCGTCTVPGEVCNPNGRCGPPCSPSTCADLTGHCGVAIDAGCGVTADCSCPGGSLICNSTGVGAMGECVPPAACAKFLANGAAGDPCSNGPSPSFPEGSGTNLTCPCSSGLCLDSDGGVVSGGAAGTCCVNTAVCPANSCGMTVTDTCTGAPIQCSCTAPGTYCDTASHMCVQTHTCASYGATGGADAGCSVGTSPAFPKDDTTNLACPCNSGGICNVPGTTTPVTPGDKGACCFNNAVCAPNECNTTKTNNCTGATITCGCTAAGTHCNNLTHQCESNNGCTAFTTGDAGALCSNGPSPTFPVGNGTNLTCTCTAPGALCFSDAGVVLGAGNTSSGRCCIPDVCPANSCNTSIVDHCSGQTIACNTCTGGQHCNTSTNRCEGNLDCAAYSATGAAGAVCSNGPSFSDLGTPPTLLTCPCSGSGVCTNGTTVVSGSARGTCCVNTVTCGNSCNTQVTNSCTGQVTACQCTGNNYCNAADAGTCTPWLTCNTQTPPANGAAGARCSTAPTTVFSRYPGDTTGLTCNCSGGRFCSVDAGVPNPPHAAGTGEIGACCTNTNTCTGAVGQRCNQTIKNSCTNADISCSCSPGNYCDTNTNTCALNRTCSAYTTGAAGSSCSNGNDPTDFPRYPGDTTGLTCRCSGSMGCYDGTGTVVSGSAKGTCCQPDVCPTGFCGTMLEHCSGRMISCGSNCGTGQYCSGTTCKPYETCSSYTTGGTGQNCSNGASATFPKGDGTNLTCPCSGAGVCVKPVPGPIVSGSTSGTCCTNTAVCPANTCGTVINTCTGATINCSCNSGYHCNGSGVCNVDQTCSSYGANGAVGNPCSTVPSSAFHDGPNNTNLTCNCSTSSPYTNNTCVGSSATMAGTCSCTPSTPANCGDNGKPNGCGGSMVSTCSPGTQVCYQSACCTLPVCKTGAKGDPCGTINQCGTMTNCGTCSTAGGNTNNTCTSNVCTCVPFTLADCGTSLPVGQTSSNGCGGTVNCPG